ncbi:MAG: MltA domain-containing protein [Phycisphaerae bacterium]|nr:MltA domain-containing protein [Phycisphaerae bacterium]
MLALSAVGLEGCRPKPIGTIMEEIPGPPPEYDRPLPPGELALRKITDPAELPDFTAACRNTKDLKEAIANSLDYLAKPSSRAYYPYGDITQERAVAGLKTFAGLLEAGLSAKQLDVAIRERFDVYTSIGWDGSGAVWFTGYYTPIFEGSLTRTEHFCYPLYAEPASLVKTAYGTVLGLRGADGRIARCPSRRDLEQSGMLTGTELAYLADPFEAYIAHVQGSARLRLGDGSLVTIGYAANNGQDYVSVGKLLVRDGKITQEELSLQRMIEHFRANPQEIYEYIWRNPRYVFFAFNEGAPRGSLNEPVTPMRTIATDKAVFPRGALALVETSLPEPYYGSVRQTPYSGFALDQDTGGAIRAAGRCDIYMGIGAEAGAVAGYTQQQGRLYYLFLKPAGVASPALPQVSPGGE